MVQTLQLTVGHEGTSTPSILCSLQTLTKARLRAQTTRIPPFASFSRVQETAHCLCPEVGGRGLEALQLTKDPQGILEMLKLCDQVR